MTKLGPIFSTYDNYLIIGDTHFPMQHEKALLHLRRCQKYFKIPDENIIQTGDLVDFFWLGAWPKGTGFALTPTQEMEQIKDTVRQWASHFKQMKICLGNHESRLYRKANNAEIPSQVLRSMEDIVGLPQGWKLQKDWLIKAKCEPFLVTHGDIPGLQGKYAARKHAEHFRMNVAFGHAHSNASIAHLKTKIHNCWGFNVGCNIDDESFAFAYGRDLMNRPDTGAGIILDGGKAPLFIPY